MLLTLPDLLSAAELRQISSWLDHAPWIDGSDSAGSQARLVKNNEQLPHECEAAGQIRATVLAALDRDARFLSAALPRRIVTPRVNRYGDDRNHYGNHVDGAIRTIGQSGLHVRTDISCTVFLTPPESYDGGELVITHGLGTSSVKLPAGHAVLYPGTSVHQVTAVTRGERIACFFWVESMVRQDEQRRLLHDMDMAILGLRQRHGDSAETVALTGAYHNLLRQWATT